jgi:hypothetical protein
MEHGIVEKIHDGFYQLAADGGEVLAAGVSAPPVEPDPVAETELPAGLPQHVEREAARAAIGAALDCLPATKDEIVRAVMPEHSLGYRVDDAIEKLDTEGERYRGAWWRRVIKPGLKANGCEHVDGVGWAK